MTGTLIREALLASIPMLEEAQRAKRRGETGTAAAAALQELEAHGAIFSIDADGKQLYPRFQFDVHFEALPSMTEILAQVPRSARSWPLLSWLNARNVLLAGRRPADLVSEQPTAVCRAARQFYSIAD